MKSRNWIRRLAVLLTAVLLLSLLTACGGKENTVSGQSGSPGSEQPAGNPGSILPAGSEAGPEQPGGPEQPDDPGQTVYVPRDSLYYVNQWKEEGEADFVSGLYYLPAPDAEPVLVCTDKGEYEANQSGADPFAYGIKAVTCSTDGQTACIMSRHWSLRERELVESSLNPWGGIGPVAERTIYYGDDYALNLYQNGTVRSDFALHVAAHAVNEDGSVLYYVERDPEDLSKGCKTLFRYDLAADTAAELDSGVTDQLVLFANGNLVWSREDGSLGFLSGSQPETLETVTNPKVFYTRAELLREDGSDPVEEEPRTELLILDKDGGLFLLSQTGEVRKLDAGVGSVEAVFADGSACWLRGDTLCFWNRTEVRELLTREELKIKAVGFRSPVLAAEAGDELLLVQGAWVRSISAAGLSWAEFDPEEQRLYYTASDDPEGNSFCALYEVDLQEDSAPRLFAEDVFQVGGLCFLNGDVCYYRDIEYKNGRNVLHKDGNAIGKLYCGDKLISENAYVESWMQRWLIKRYNTCYLQGSILYWEGTELEPYVFETRTMLYDGTESTVVWEGDNLLYPLVRNGRGDAFLLSGDSEDATLYLYADGILHPLVRGSFFSYEIEKYQ